MEKYATYRVFKNIETGEITKIPLTAEGSLEKTAELSNSDKYVELSFDPEVGE